MPRSYSSPIVRIRYKLSDRLRWAEHQSKHAKRLSTRERAKAVAEVYRFILQEIEKVTQ